MLGKVPIKRGDTGSSFRALIAYVTRTADAPVPDLDTFTNCLSLQTAPAEMQAVAARSARVHDPVFHFVISWRAGEHPNRDQAMEAGRAALEALGMAPDAHQHVFAIHRDTDNVHLHVVVNRVSLEMGRAVHPGLSYLKLDRCMRELERRQGWQPDRGPYAMIEHDGQITIERERTTARPPRPARARDMEAFSGIESLASYVSGAPTRDVLAALNQPGATWQDVHEALARHGLELRVKGHGLAIYAKARDDLTPVKASSVHEQLGRGKLEKRLGPWAEPMRAIRVSSAERRYLEREIDPARVVRREARARMRAELRTNFERDQARQRGEFDAARRQMRTRHQTGYRTVLERHRRVREQIRASRMPRAERKAAYSVSAFERMRELEALREAQSAERDALTRPQTYREWVEMRAREGDEAAIAQLRGWAYTARRRHKTPVEPERRNRITGLFGDDSDPLPPTRAQVLADWTWRVDTTSGNVDYLRHGARQFTDEGWGVVFGSNAAQWDAMLAGLLLARQKFGPQIDVSGNDDFRERTVMLAVAYRLDVTFGDDILEARRMQLVQVQRRRDQARAQEAQRTPAQPTDTRSPAPTPERPSGGQDLSR
ncbi:relaxase/mobilization nuclease domain-containing protein [Burkholderia contaminans]|uniref:TraI/MobA(P) family conjugative relaxase n=1 Tax=Burkholderia contaminans TaxID=488447 RepID=UPI001CF38B0D|nr:TraI/MobA(P) family conjugative relaxase [Burkholderia contaminans]MCA7885981.1 relaxase/mobilization nuclease domain-containing protein [Burkholderia contaminans]HEM7879390.1 relaxase/mobilization nuclease domain-containing protein [Burkholderia contaminans]